MAHLQNTDEPEVEAANIKLSECCDISTLSKSLQSTNGGLSKLSLNNQSQRAKFCNFQFVVIEKLNKTNAISVICLQETWLSSESPTLLYVLPNYQLISRGKYCSHHGGLITYVT